MTSTFYGVKVTAPGSAPTLTQGAATGSLSGNYSYKISFTTSVGETTPSSASGTVAITGTGALTAIPTGGANVIGRKIYRTAAGGSTYLLVTTISDNTTTTYNDTLADGSLGAAALTVSTADSQETIYGYSIHDKLVGFASNVAVTAIAAGGTLPILTATNNIVTTVPATGQVQLQPILANIVGVELSVRNSGANPLLIVPASGQTINGGASLALGVGAYVRLFASSATNWQQIAP